MTYYDLLDNYRVFKILHTLPYDIVVMLHGLHVDTFELIPAGIAIDINTI